MTATLDHLDTPTLGRPSSARVAWAVASMLARESVRDRSGWALPVVALAVVSSLSLSVAGGVHYFWRTTGELSSMYRTFSAVALVLLVIPLGTLAGAAARLSTARRDVRLSSLRLLGATRGTVHLMTLLETGAISVMGALAGVVGYLGLMPVFGLLHFNRAPIGVSGMWLGIGPVLAALLVVVLICLVSATIGLRKVVITPLGVRTRQRAKASGLARLVGTVALVLAGMVCAKLAGAQASMVVAAVMVLAMLALPMMAVVLGGPWFVQLAARHDLRRARTAVQLMAARATLEDPKALWRQIAPLGLSTFVAVFLGMAMSLSSKDLNSETDRLVATDLRTGALLTLALTFVTVACSVSINQTAAVLDRRSLHVGLDLIGMPVAMMDRARRRAVLRPLVWVVLGSGLVAVAMIAPLGVLQEVADVSVLVMVLVVVAGGIGLVVGALAVSRHTVEQVVRDGLQRSE